VDGRELILQRKFRDPCGFRTKNRIRKDEHSSVSGLRNHFKGCRELFHSTHLENVQRPRSPQALLLATVTACNRGHLEHEPLPGAVRRSFFGQLKVTTYALI
jgi:hypothetical protein